MLLLVLSTKQSERHLERETFLTSCTKHSRIYFVHHNLFKINYNKRLASAGITHCTNDFWSHLKLFADITFESIMKLHISNSNSCIKLCKKG